MEKSVPLQKGHNVLLVYKKGSINQLNIKL